MKANLVKTGFFVLLMCVFISSNIFSQTSHKTDWFKDAKYGLLIHFLHSLQNTREPWNQGRNTSWDSCVNGFNVKRFADDVYATGAKYVMFTVQQNDKYFCIPNNTFEQITGYKRGTATSHRDLIMDIYNALKPKGIKLMLYVTGNGPFKDSKAMNLLHIETMNSFVSYWGRVLKEISMRYKSKVSGWWMDGAYAYIGHTDSTLAVLAKALKTGNPNSILAFNQAPRDTVTYYTHLDDFTAGEMYSLNTLPKGRFIRGVRWHTVTFLGADWALPGLRYTDKQLSNYIQTCNNNGGVVTVDMCLLKDGSLERTQKDLMMSVKEQVRGKK